MQSKSFIKYFKNQRKEFYIENKGKQIDEKRMDTIWEMSYRLGSYRNIL